MARATSVALADRMASLRRSIRSAAMCSASSRTADDDLATARPAALARRPRSTRGEEARWGTLVSVVAAIPPLWRTGTHVAVHRSPHYPTGGGPAPPDDPSSAQDDEDVGAEVVHRDDLVVLG